MKKLLLLLLFIPLMSFGQDTIPAIPLQPLIKSAPAIPMQADRYVLYPTENIWIHLMLNTSSGFMWQVQWHTDSELRFTTVLNNASLVPNDNDFNDNQPTGRFKLYPTQNTFNFLLLDQETGRTWQVQWNNDEDKRFITPIY